MVATVRLTCFPSSTITLLIERKVKRAFRAAARWHSARHSRGKDTGGQGDGKAPETMDREAALGMSEDSTIFFNQGPNASFL